MTAVPDSFHYNGLLRFSVLEIAPFLVQVILVGAHS